MSQLESVLAVAGEAPGMLELDYTLPPSNTAIVDRKQHLRAYPTSSSTLTPGGNRVCRIRLGGDDFVDSSSVRLMYTITNLDGTNPLTPLCGPWGMWSQLYLRSNGVEIDNIPHFGRFCEMHAFKLLPFADQWAESAVCGLGGSWPATGVPTNTPKMGTIAANASYTVIHKVPASLFNSGRFLPCRYVPLELEMSLSSNVGDWLSAATNTSQTYQISNIQLMYNSVTLDESITESLYKAVLSSRTLSLPCISVYQVVQNIPTGSTSFSFASVRAFSRLSHVWLTFRGTGARSAEFLCPTTPVGTGAVPSLADGGVPLARLSIGPKNYPDPQSLASIPEMYYQLQQALGYSPNITRDQFQTNCFTICWDLRKTPGDPSTAISTRSGDLLNITLQNMTANAATECWLTMFAFSVVACREQGVTLLT